MSWKQSGCQMSGEVTPLSPSSRIRRHPIMWKLLRNKFNIAHIEDLEESG